MTLVELKSALKIQNANEDDLLEDVLAAAEAAIARRIGLTNGTLESSTYTERVSPNGGYLVLKAHPVIALTSVTPYNGTALTVDDLDVADGLVTKLAGGSFGTAAHTVVYTAGWATGEVPEDLRRAVIELARHMWQTQRGPTGRPGAPSNEPVPGAGYYWPHRVQEVLAAYELPGIA